ncbi:MAG: DNA-protecting protein DprA [Proteobacteria bacterium]|nr:DNA-protecting protein DprA [Pseudomonadota bacterium]
MMVTPSPFLDFQPPKKNELISWIRLNRTLNLNSRLFYQLLQHYGTAQDVLQKIPILSKLGRLPFFSICSEQTAEEELKKVQDLQGEIILLGSPFYPSILLSIPHPPPLLTVLGNKSLLNQKIIGGTGCRKASHQANQFAKHLASHLGKNKYVIATGLSEGIEISLHKGALCKGTIVILAGGIDVIVPLKHKNLSQKILEYQGVFISEFPLGVFPTSSHFLRQTRLISGISKGIILIEATVNSTAFHLTEMALEQGRDVFAVPGFPLDPQAYGTNFLIQQGATLIHSAQDILNFYDRFF